MEIYYGKVNKSLAKALYPRDIDIKDFIVIDVRNRGYFIMDHIREALNIESSKRIGFIAEENKDKKILLYCHSGSTAATIGSELVKKGYNNIYFLDASFADVIRAGIDVFYHYEEDILKKHGGDN